MSNLGLAGDDPTNFSKFVRMDETAFKELLTLVIPIIERKDTIMVEGVNIGCREVGVNPSLFSNRYVSIQKRA